MFAIAIMTVGAAYPAVAGVIAVAVSLSTTSWIRRLAVLYATCLTLGLGLIVVGETDERTGLFITGFLLVIAGWSRERYRLQTFMLVLGVLFMFLATVVVLGNGADLGWIIRGTMVMAFVSTIALGFRLLGFRLMSLCPLDGETTMLIGMDMTWNDIIIRLDETVRPSDSPEQVYDSVLRLGFGDWSPAIEHEYLKISGRIPIGRTFDGRPEKVSRPMFQDKQGHWRARPSRPDEVVTEAWAGSRFSISQMMIWSAAMASFFAFARVFASDFPGQADLSYGPGLAVTLCLTSLTSAMGVLSLPPRRRIIVRCVIVALLAVIAAPYLLALQGFKIYYLQAITLFASLVGLWQCFCFSLFRERGYRIVRVRSV